MSGTNQWLDAYRTYGVRRFVERLREEGVIVAHSAGTASAGDGWLVPYAVFVWNASAFRAVDNYVYERVRHFLRRRHKVSSRATGVPPVASHWQDAHAEAFRPLFTPARS